MAHPQIQAGLPLCAAFSNHVCKLIKKILLHNAFCFEIPHKMFHMKRENG